MGEVEKQSFIALPGKGGHTGFVPSQVVYPSLGGVGEEFYSDGSRMELLIRTEVCAGPVCVCCAKSLQSCPTLCDSMDYSLPGSSVRGILQARTLERVAVPVSGGSSRPRDRTHVSCGFLYR